VSQKNVPPVTCYNFDTRECILTFFGRNVTDKVINQKTLYCATSNKVCFCTTWQMAKHENRIFSLKCCISALPEFNQVAPWFLQSFCLLSDSWLILTLLYESLHLVINAFSSGAVGRGMVKEKGSWECCSSWTVLHAQCMCTNVLSSSKKKCHLWCVW